MPTYEMISLGFVASTTVETYQIREPSVYNSPLVATVEVTETSSQNNTDRQGHIRSTHCILPTEKWVDNRQVSQSSQTTTGNIGARDPTADDGEEDKPIGDMREPHHSGPFNGNDEGAPQGTTTIDEIFIIVWYAHSDDPDIDHKKGGHSPKYRINGVADRLSWLLGLPSNYSDMLTSSKAKESLDERFGNTFNAIVKCTRVLPVAKLYWPVCGRNAARCHDKHEEYDCKNGQAFDERHDILNMAIETNPKYVCESDCYQEDSNIRCQRHGSCFRPELKH